MQKNQLSQTLVNNKVENVGVLFSGSCKRRKKS